MTAMLRGAAILATLLAAGQARADVTTIAGRALVLTDTLSEDTVVATDASLSGRIRVTMENPSCLSVVDGETAVVSTARCGSEAGTLRVDVPEGTSLTLAVSGQGDVHLGNMTGRLIATLTGDGSLVAGRTGGVVLATRSSADATLDTIDGPATLDLASSGDVTIRHMAGPLTVRSVSSGDLVVGGIQADAVTADVLGSGDVMVGTGNVRALQARVLGSGDMAVAATVGTADVTAHGQGDVKLASVTGTLRRDAGRNSDITVGNGDTLRNQISRKLSGETTEATGGGLHGGALIRHFLTLAVLGLIGWIGWRIVQRGGGLASLRRSTAPPTTPANPAVTALGETMARLEQRLGLLESYVTTREFDLNRRFREMG